LNSSLARNDIQAYAGAAGAGTKSIAEPLGVEDEPSDCCIFAKPWAGIHYCSASCVIAAAMQAATTKLGAVLIRALVVPWALTARAISSRVVAGEVRGGNATFW
jgi:hypothetical protein